MAVKATNKAPSNKKDSKPDTLDAKESDIQQDLEANGQKSATSEDHEDLEDEQASSGDAAGGNAAALAAAANSGTESASFKNFRHHPDMENFYRFIYENDLRHEALAIIDQIMIEKQVRKQVKANKAQPN